MKIFSPLYERAMRWARHRHAPWYLGGMSFAESSFFPIPPDVMLAPMSLAQPNRAVFFATLTTLASVVGGIFGYLIGTFAFDLLEPALSGSSYYEKYLLAREWFDEARRVLEEEGQRPLRATVDFDEALAHARRNGPGDRERASELLEVALERFEPLGMTGWARRAQDLKRQCEEMGP